MEEAIRLIRPGVTELDIAAEIGYRMREKGASGESFEAIVAAGPRSALPHARPTARQIGKNELVVLDLGAILRPLLQRLTRHGARRQGVQSSPRLVPRSSDAQTAARDALKSGVTCGPLMRRPGTFCIVRGWAGISSIARVMGLALKSTRAPESLGTKKRFWRRENVVTLEPGVYVEGVGGIGSKTMPW